MAPTANAALGVDANKVPVALTAFTQDSVTGAVGITAAGTNQNINLTPSGTGYVFSLGDIRVDKTTSQAEIRANANAGQVRNLAFRSAGLSRWWVYADSASESGSNAGSDFRIARFNDAGTIIDTPLQISRATGAIIPGPSIGIQVNAALTTDDTYTATQQIGGLLAGATIAQWEVVYVGASSTYLLADANGSGTYPAVGIAIAAYSSTNPAVVITSGTVRNDAWNFTPGGRLYLSATPGGLTQTAPSTSGDKVQDVGVALTADIALFQFNGVYVEVE